MDVRHGAESEDEARTWLEEGMKSKVEATGPGFRVGMELRVWFGVEWEGSN